ncbi:MAG: 3-dehydroquinate synthase [Clostridia bacterium]|nr:3-dehydroquinate synthase [Clostridia bacterium]
MIISVKTRDGEYPIIIEKGALNRAGEVFKLDRRCFIVTDDGVPEQYVKTLAAQCKESVVFKIKAGEESKTLDSFSAGLKMMLEYGFTRSDCVAAVGGGVVGDLAGFIASAFMRGVDFYNVPTTVLAQVDSSVGGKTAVNFEGSKNMIGAFYPPRAVLIDPETLKTLPQRQISNGLAEAVKMAACMDEKLFSLIENGDVYKNLEEIIAGSVMIKKHVVEQDERERGLRRLLNFGHTLAHAIEAESIRGGKTLYHGECVAIGMLPLSSEKARARLVPVLKKLSLPTELDIDAEKILDATLHDKKKNGENITLVRLKDIGKYEFDTVPFDEWEHEVKGWFEK